MITRKVVSMLVLLITAWILTACLGEPRLPDLEAIPAAALEPPPVDPTLAAASRISLRFGGDALASVEHIPQIPHDLIGRSDCLMCHKQGVSGAPRIPDAHRGLNSLTCQSCHTAPASAELGGAELYLRLCARCHGENGEGRFGPALNTKGYLQNVSDEELREAVMRGRGQTEMLAWGDLGLLTNRQIDEMVAMIRGWEPTAPESPGILAPDSPSSAAGEPEQGEALFAQFCSGCHGFTGEAAVGEAFILRDAVGSLDDVTLTRQIRGGSSAMPPFHAVLTTDDISDLLALMRTWHAGPEPAATPIVLSGEEVFARVCARCHGPDGDGGIGPPLNSREFLAANDDPAIEQWIARGTLGTSMLSWGDLGLLTPEQISELVDFIRAWEATAPSTVGAGTVEAGASASLGKAAHGEQLFAQFCSGCHGLRGDRKTAGFLLNSAEFLDGRNDEIIASQIQNGGREMPSFHSILTGQDVNDLLSYMRSGFSGAEPAPGFSGDVLPILADECAICHGAAGGWSAATYDDVMTTGDHGPVVIQGDPAASLLAQKILGAQNLGGIMPPSGLMPEDKVQIILDWISAGALDS
ncbi:MAG: hypothetical protein BMS9Abin28_0120 [Anaerolineae bacterium]|nr:MAG: hypothetical protein BMS9Abin28_0120 [Anaerolineae bacterium]